MSRVVGVIPARYGSSRFPGKPLAMIAGKPLIQRTWEAASQADLDALVVATDDDRIGACCEGFGATVVMTASDHPTGTDRLAEVARQMEADCFVNIQGDEPMVPPEAIHAVVDAFKQDPSRVVNAMCTIDDEEARLSRNVPKVVVDERSSLVYMSRAPVPFLPDGQPAKRQVCIYAFGPDHLQAYAAHPERSLLERGEDIEILRFLDLGVPVHMVEVPPVGPAVDTEEDRKAVEHLLS